MPPAPDDTFGSLCAASVRMRAMFGLLRRLAPTMVTVTICGETGTGKDVLAHAIHKTSERAAGPFVVFDCGAVPPSLVESELYGHDRGAFTGAHTDHLGAFERAVGGTLFLDEIGELPLDLQPRLLRALESRRVRRVGGTRDRQVDVRILAATNRDLPQLVSAKLFRQDLFFRLAGAVVEIPPLRNRLEDLPLLVTELLRDLDRADVRASMATLDHLRGHAWTGNVRELKNALACALAFVDGGVLEPQHVRLAAAAPRPPGPEQPQLGGQTLADVEQMTIEQTLELTRGNRTHAARLLGISPSTLHEKLRGYPSGPLIPNRT